MAVPGVLKGWPMSSGCARGGSWRLLLPPLPPSPSPQSEHKNAKITIFCKSLDSCPPQRHFSRSVPPTKMLLCCHCPSSCRPVLTLQLFMYGPWPPSKHINKRTHTMPFLVVWHCLVTGSETHKTVPPHFIIGVDNIQEKTEWKLPKRWDKIYCCEKREMP